MMKVNHSIIQSLHMTIKTSAVALVAMLAGFYMSYLAELFEQETGLGTAILGYNRDFLVDGRWYFFSGLVFCIFFIISSKIKINQLQK